MVSDRQDSAVVMPALPGLESERLNIVLSVDKNLFAKAHEEGAEVLLMNKLLTTCFGTLMVSSVNSPATPSPDENSHPEEQAFETPSSHILPVSSNKKRKRKRRLPVNGLLFSTPKKEPVASPEYHTPSNSYQSKFAQLFANDVVEKQSTTFNSEDNATVESTSTRDNSNNLQANGTECNNNENFQRKFDAVSVEEVVPDSNQSDYFHQTIEELAQQESGNTAVVTPADAPLSDVMFLNQLSTPTNLLCPVCHVSCQALSALRQHLSVSHQEDISSAELDSDGLPVLTPTGKLKRAPKIHCCTFCDYRTRWSSTFRRHVESHSRKYSYFCDQCQTAIFTIPELHNDLYHRSMTTNEITSSASVV